MIRPWTSTSSITDLILKFFNLADRALSKIAPEAEDEIARESRSQLPRIGMAVFRAFQERLEGLDRYVVGVNNNVELFLLILCINDSPIAAEEIGIDSERRTFREKFQEVRPHVLHTLCKLYLISLFK